MLLQNAKHWDIRGKMDITLFYREKGTENRLFFYMEMEKTVLISNIRLNILRPVSGDRAGYERTWKISPGDKSLYDQAVFVRFI